MTTFFLNDYILKTDYFLHCYLRIFRFFSLFGKNNFKEYISIIEWFDILTENKNLIMWNETRIQLKLHFREKKNTVRPLFIIPYYLFFKDDTDALKVHCTIFSVVQGGAMEL